MNTVRTYTEKLESVIKQGEELRDQMRREMETMKAIIEKQSETIRNQSKIINDTERVLTVYKRRFTNRSQHNQSLRGQIKKLTVDNNKIQTQLNQKEQFTKSAVQWIKDNNFGQLPEELRVVK